MFSAQTFLCITKFEEGREGKKEEKEEEEGGEEEEKKRKLLDT